jgi:hypothetical protein
VLIVIKRLIKGQEKLRPMVVLTLAFFSLIGFSRAVQSIDASEYITSEGCKECHEEIFDQWKLSSHARMLRNAKEDPSAIEADNFSEEIPFTKDDIEYALGSHWIQKYLTRIDGELYILPKFWNIVKQEWEPYSIWNWRNRPYSHHCNWCHSVGYDTETRTYVEESIGCEACHGPGKKHAESGEPADIVNPAKLSKVRADMICESCHTDGKDRSTKTYPFPDGFVAGEDLTNYYTDFFVPKPGSKGWYKGEMSYLERHRMFLFWQTRFYSNARSCEVCEFDRQINKKVKGGYMTRDEYCGTCHGDILSEFKSHSNHSPKDVRCIECHPPSLDATGERYSIHDHKFDFSAPEIVCVECHGDAVPESKEGHSHSFTLPGPVQAQGNLAIEETCAKCHDDLEKQPVPARTE